MRGEREITMSNKLKYNRLDVIIGIKAFIAAKQKELAALEEEQRSYKVRSKNFQEKRERFYLKIIKACNNPTFHHRFDYYNERVTVELSVEIPANRFPVELKVPPQDKEKVIESLQDEIKEAKNTLNLYAKAQDDFVVISTQWAIAQMRSYMQYI